MEKYIGNLNTVDIKSSFINNLYPDGFIPSKYVNAQSFKDRMMGNYKYRDPDADSEDLYKSLFALYNGRTLPNGGQFKLGALSVKNGYHFEISIPNIIYKISSDYIGPSATGAFHSDIDDQTVGEAILACRTIGGHTIWPRHTNSVSQARGGSLTDRIDLTLAELKDFYANPTVEQYLYSKKLRTAFYMDKEWLLQFESFQGFCDFFFFTRSFVDEQYNIIWLAPIHKENYYRPQDYASFMKNNEHYIQARTLLIKAFLSKKKGNQNPTLSETAKSKNEFPKERSFENSVADYFSRTLLVILIGFMSALLLTIFTEAIRGSLDMLTVIFYACLSLPLIYFVYRIFRWRHRNTNYCSQCKKTFWLEKKGSIITKKSAISIRKELETKNSSGNVIKIQEQYIPGTRYFYKDSYQCLHCGTNWNITYSEDRADI